MNFTTFSTKKDGSVMTVTLNNGEVNMMSATMAVELSALVEQLKQDTDTKVVVFESANAEFFIAHFDINDIVKLLEGDTSFPQGRRPDLNVLQSLGLSLKELPQVTIAKVDGICRGGGFEFMLAFDMCFASAQAKFCFPEASLGFLPAGGGSTLLPFKAGNAKALEVMLTGRDFSGTEAAEYNFINRALPTGDDLNTYVADAVRRITRNDMTAIEAVKSVSQHIYSILNDDILECLVQENVSMGKCLTNPSTFEKLKFAAKNSGSRELELDLPATIAGMS